MADNVLEPYTFSFGDANPASNGCSSRVWVSPTSILQRKTSRCIYVCIACGCYEASQGASQIWKSFCKSDRPFSSSTWCERLFFFCSGSFRVCNRSKQGELVPTHDFWHGIPGHDPARESRKTPLEGSRKSVQRERHPKFEITLIRKTRTSSSDFALKFISYPLKTGTTSS